MAIPIDQAVTSFESLISTIEKDGQTYYWFAYLIAQPALRERLSAEKGVEQSYRNLDSIVVKQRILYIILLFLFGAVVVSGLYILAGIAVVLAAIVYMHFKKKKIVADICSCLFLQDFKEFFFAKKTLYQIGEFYGQEYKILSLVDGIAISDRAVWSAFIITFFVTYFIYPLNPGYIFLCVIASLYIVRAIANTPFIYKHIK